MSSIADRLMDNFSQMGVGARSVFVLLTAVLDSSVVSLPEINDALLFYLTTISPRHAPYLVLAATGGSVLGCLLLNRLAHWKGPGLVERLSPSPRSRAGLALYRRYGVWTLVVPALLPPPCPFKIFVLSSGVLGLPVHRFVLAVVVGRAIRYSLGAVLAIHYGEWALELLRDHAAHVVGMVGIAFVAVLALGLKRILGGRALVGTHGAFCRTDIQEES